MGQDAKKPSSFIKNIIISKTTYAPPPKDLTGPDLDPQKTYIDNEIISTAFEGLFDDPETFARTSPEHFDLLLRLLRGEKP